MPEDCPKGYCETRRLSVTHKTVPTKPNPTKAGDGKLRMLAFLRDGSPATKNPKTAGLPKGTRETLSVTR
jgi:hypothetical protein